MHADQIQFRADLLGQKARKKLPAPRPRQQTNRDQRRAVVLVDRLDSGLLGARPTIAREDLCAALLAARLHDLAQAAPRGGTVVTYACVRE